MKKTKKPLRETMFRARQREALREAGEFKRRFFKPGIRVLGVSGSARDRHDMAQEDSTTEWLLGKCLDEAKKLGAETRMIQLRKYDIRPCKACYSTTNTQCHFPCSCYPKGEAGDDMTNKLYDICLWADVIIFATPVNNFKISSYMALFIDRLISMDGSLAPADPKDRKNRGLNIAHTKFIAQNGGLKFGSGFLRRFTGKIGGMIVTGHEAGVGMAISQMFMTFNHFGMLFPPFSNMYAMNTACDSTYNDKKKLQIFCHEKEARILAKNLVIAAKVAKRENDYWWVYGGGVN